MGCGKTTLGKKLAGKMGFSFVDLDKKIEERTGMSIPQYFEQFGEARFREQEREVLQSGLFPENAIIATGGGAPCFFDNMEWMNAQGITVYLSLSPKALADRLQNATDERPLLKEHKGEALVAFIESRLAVREEFYKKALITVNGVDLTAEKLSGLLEEYQRR